MQAKRSERLHVLIPCAGQGLRAGGGSPKHLRLIAGKPMLAHTLSVFQRMTELDSIHVVLRPGDAQGEAICSEFPRVTALMVGGESRALSVSQGLDVLESRGARANDWVLVHDAARCGVTAALVERLIESCESDAVGGLLALPLPDTLKQAENGRVLRTVDRADKWLAQTPQMFRLALLRQALVSSPACSDEASAVEALGLAPKLVPGSLRNAKVTYQDDFEIMEKLLS